MHDPFGIGEESPGEKRARINMENDLRFLHSFIAACRDRGASSEDVDRFAAIDDPRLSDIRRLAHAASSLVWHTHSPSMSQVMDELFEQEQYENEASRD